MENKDLLKLQNGSDIRGIALDGVPGENVNLTQNECLKIGSAFVQWLAKKTQKPANELTIGIGRDSRLSGPSLEEALVKGMVFEGAKVVRCGMATTPAMFMSIVFEQTSFAGSVMITASHLPFNRNGVKQYGWYFDGKHKYYFNPTNGGLLSGLRKINGATYYFEHEKGNALTKEAYEILEQAENINFTGNIEPRNVPYGEADVIVCDGFVGNTILKLSEGLAKTMLDIIKGEIMKGYYKIGAAILKKPFKNVKKFMDSDEIGGAPFIGLKSLVVKAHGSSNAKAIKNAVRQCVVFTEADIIGKIKDKL